MFRASLFPCRLIIGRKGFFVKGRAYFYLGSLLPNEGALEGEIGGSTNAVLLKTDGAVKQQQLP